MRKFISICVGLVIGASAFAEVLLFENFEKSNSPEIDKMWCPSYTQISRVKKNAIAGKASLLLDCTHNTKHDFPKHIRLFNNNLPNKSLITISFKYKVLKQKRTPAENYLVVESVGKKKSNRIHTKVFGEELGSSGVVKETFFVSFKDDEKIIIDLTARGGTAILIDDLKVVADKLSVKSDWLLDKSSFIGMRHTFGYPYFLTLNKHIFSIDKKDFFPFVDKYGQFKHSDWIFKTKSDADFAKHIELEQRFYKENPPIKNRDKFGGLVGKYNFGKSKHFRVKKVEGKWFFITPEGNLFWSIGIDGVATGSATPITDREFYFDDVSDKRFQYHSKWGKFDYEKPHDAFDFGTKNLERKFGKWNVQIMAKHTHARSQHWGFNTQGAWSAQSSMIHSNVPFTVYISASSGMKLDSKGKLYGYWSKPVDYFDPNFEKEAHKRLSWIKKLVSEYMIGVFVDNELPWQTETLRLPKCIITTPTTQPAKIKMAEIFKAKYTDIQKLNKAWNAKYTSWQHFIEERDFVPSTKQSDADLIEFEKAFYARYFQVCRDAVKKQLGEEVLYLGCRFAWVNEILPVVASNYCDVVSYNFYRSSVATVELPKGSQDRPIIIGEYHFGSADRGIVGCGLVPQKNRFDVAKAYTSYTISAIENPAIVGAHWFQYNDQLTTGRSDGENYAIGFVDICDTPDYLKVKAMRKIAENVYKVRLSNKRTSKKIKEKTITY